MIAYRLLIKKPSFSVIIWSVYQAVIPSEQQRPVGKETGETAHIGRWNNTLRQYLARLVRKTLSFSKCIKMHEICLKLFVHRYNTEIIADCWLDITSKIITTRFPTLSRDVPGFRRRSVYRLAPRPFFSANTACAKIRFIDFNLTG